MRLTAEEARQILFNDIDRVMETLQVRAADNEDCRAELKILARHRQRQSSSLESLLSQSHKSDQIWHYRTYVTADRRGGESGIALVRNGKVIGQMQIMIFD